MLLFYLRHGDPIYDPDSLTELGHSQAEALSLRLASFGLDRIFSSPSIRARQTAEPTCKRLGIEAELCDFANESLVWGEFALETERGRRWSFFYDETVRIFLSPEVYALGEDWPEHPELKKYGFERGLKRVNEGVDDFFLSLGYRHDRKNKRYEIVKENDGRVALFAHQGFGISFFSSMLDIPYPLFSTHFDFGHSSMSVVNFEKRGDFAYPRVLQLSNDSHLYREDILTGYQNRINF